MTTMRYLLFTTTTCIKCPEFKAFVEDKIDFEGEILNEQSADFAESLTRYGVSTAPTILIFEDDTELLRTSELFELEEFLQK